MKSKSSKKTAKTGPQDATKKVFDVMRPGKTPVSPTSRPVIVGHKPQVKDPMMSDRDERPLMDSNKKVTVQPAADASVPLPPTNKDTTPAVLPPTDADSGGLPSANPSLAQVDSRTTPVAGGTDGGAPGAPQPSGEHDGEVSMSDRTRTPELVGGSTGEVSMSDRTRTEASEPEEATTAPEVPENEKLPEQTTAESVATIATSSVVDDVPSPPETTTSPQPPHPMTTGNTTSGLVFDDPDDILNSDANPDPTSKDTGPAAHGGPSSANAANATSTGSLPTASPATDDNSAEPAVSGQAIVSHHKQSSGMTTVLISLLVLLLVAGIIIDILLDMGILNISNIPHTNFFPSN